MGKSGGFIAQLTGFVLTVAGMLMNAVAPGSGTWLMASGMAMMFGGSIWAADSARKAAHEAMDRLKNQSRGMKANTRTTQRVIPVVYGRSRVGGNIVYMKATGPNNNDLHLVYGISEGPVDGFEEVWFNNVKVWDVASCTSQVDSADNGKIDGPYKDWFSVSFRFGTNSQDRFWQINSAGDADFQDQYPLMAAAYVKMIYNQNVYQSVPQVNFVLRGRTTTDNSTPTQPTNWNMNPVNVLYDQMTDQRYGWGLPSSKLNLASINSAAVYANGSCAVFADFMQETVDRHDIPLAWTGTFKHMTTSGPGYVAVDIGKLGAPSQTGTLPTYFTSRLPIRAGSMSASFMIPQPYEAVTLTDTYAGTNPSTGAIYSGAGSFYGNVNYATGVASIDTLAITENLSGEITTTTYERTMTFNWIADYEFAYRTAYKFLARSVYSYVGSEFFTETASAVLASNSGGTGTVDYTNGVITLKPRGTAHLSGEQPRVYYKVQTATGLTRFTYNGMLLDAQKAIDVFRETATHFRGFVVYSNGQYYFHSDGPGSSIYSFNDDNIIAGTFKIQQAPISERPNRVRVKYVDAAMNYSPSDILYETDSPAVVVADQRELTLELPGCAFRDVAHRMGQTLANQVALGNNIEFQTTLDASAVKPGDIIDVTHPSASWSAKLFRVYETNEAQDGGMSLKAVEHADNVYVDEWQFGKPADFSPTFLPTRTFFPPAVTSLSIREIAQTLSDGTTTPMLEVTAESLASSANVGGYKFWLAEASASSKATQLLYSGPSNKHVAHVKPGMYSVTAFTYSEMDQSVLSAKGLTIYGQVFGEAQYEWQKFRLSPVAANVSINSWSSRSLSIYSCLHPRADSSRARALTAIRVRANSPQDSFMSVYMLSAGKHTLVASWQAASGQAAMGNIAIVSNSSTLYSVECSIEAVAAQQPGIRLRKIDLGTGAPVSSSWIDPVISNAPCMEMAGSANSGWIHLYGCKLQVGGYGGPYGLGYYVVSTNLNYDNVFTVVASFGSFGWDTIGGRTGSADSLERRARMIATRTDSYMFVFGSSVMSKNLAWGVASFYPNTCEIRMWKYASDMSSKIIDGQLVYATAVYSCSQTPTYAVGAIDDNTVFIALDAARIGGNEFPEPGRYVGYITTSDGLRISGLGVGDTSGPGARDGMIANPVYSKYEGNIYCATVKEWTTTSVQYYADYDVYAFWKVASAYPVFSQTWV